MDAKDDDDGDFSRALSLLLLNVIVLAGGRWSGPDGGFSIDLILERGLVDWPDWAGEVQHLFLPG